MIDASEPKDGDFVRYVESMVRLPAGVRLPDQSEGPGSTMRVSRRERAMQKMRAAASEAPRAADLARSAGREGQWGPSVEQAPASGRSGAQRPGFTTNIEQAAQQAVRVLLIAVRRIGTVMLVAGAALLAISFADESPLGANPIPGFALMFAGALMRGLAARALR